MPLKEKIGLVISDKMNKSIVVEIEIDIHTQFTQKLW